MNGGNPRRVAHRSPAVGEGWGTYRLSSSGVTPPSFRFTVAPDNKDQNQSGDACVRRMEYHSLGQRKRELADVLQLLLIHTEIVATSWITVMRICSRISSSVEQTASMFFW